jgi:glyoxylase-like metal-dependent hydrolase (beta-lactamase superfamily II)
MDRNKIVADSWFDIQHIHQRLVWITEPYYWQWNRANSWLIRGRDQDLLFDTGTGVADLRTALANQLRKPLLVVASHVHFDHAGGLHAFDTVAIHAAEADALAGADSALTLSDPKYGWILDDHFSRLPAPDFQASQYRFRSVASARRLEDGEWLNLGDRSLNVIHLPGHSPGCIALYDPDNRELYSGDVVYDGELLDTLPGSDPDVYAASAHRLLSLPVRTVYPGHYKPFDGDRMRELLAAYLSRIAH